MRVGADGGNEVSKSTRRNNERGENKLYNILICNTPKVLLLL
jgi:hypothetical protein